METKSRQILDRLAGRNVKDVARIRRMSYYGTWRRYADWLDTNPSKAEILRAIHRAKDDRSYGYAWKSEKSAEALELVCQERHY